MDVVGANGATKEPPQLQFVWTTSDFTAISKMRSQNDEIKKIETMEYKF